MKAIMSALMVLLFACCGADVNPKSTLPPAPPKAKSAVENVNKAQASLDSSISENDKIKSKISENKKILDQQKTDIEDSIYKLQKLEQKIVAGGKLDLSEARLLLTELNEIRKKNGYLAINIDEMAQINSIQAKLLAETRVIARDLKKEVLDKENEAEELRRQRNAFEQTIKDRDSDVIKLQSALSKAKENEARNGVYRNALIGTGVILLVAGIVILIFKFKII